MKNLFENKEILVTGGCGSIGSEIVQQLVKFKPRRIRVFDNNESGHFYLNQKLESNGVEISNLIGDVRDRDRVIRAIEGVDIVFHAAALKHVPFCEYNPFEAVATNVLGTENVVSACIKNKVKLLLSISTDKAVNPINTMGATKLLSEKIVINAPIGPSGTKMACVRFGNVLNSVGSVIPIFFEQIKKGGPLTITSTKMTRFFMSMEEAVELVLKSAKSLEGGEVFILKMESLRVIDLAEVMIEELAPKFGHKKIEIEKIGLRPGEKLNESLISKEEAPFVKTKDDMYILKNNLLADIVKVGEINIEDYNSENVQQLSKDEIRKRLKNILSNL